MWVGSFNRRSCIFLKHSYPSIKIVNWYTYEGECVYWKVDKIIYFKVYGSITNICLRILYIYSFYKTFDFRPPFHFFNIIKFSECVQGKFAHLCILIIILILNKISCENNSSVIRHVSICVNEHWCLQAKLNN